jgi:hypothetical protein
MPTCPSFHSIGERFPVRFTKPAVAFPVNRSRKEKQWLMRPSGGMLSVVKVKAPLELL